MPECTFRGTLVPLDSSIVTARFVTRRLIVTKWLQSQQFFQSQLVNSTTFDVRLNFVTRQTTSRLETIPLWQWGLPFTVAATGYPQHQLLPLTRSLMLLFPSVWLFAYHKRRSQCSCMQLISDITFLPGPSCHARRLCLIDLNPGPHRSNIYFLLFLHRDYFNVLCFPKF